MLGSEIFEIVAESGQKRFHVHAGILARQSGPLQSVTTGGWKESTEKTINLLDWDGDTVARFVDFLYIGDYQVPDPGPLSDVEESGRASVQPSEGRSPLTGLKPPEPSYGNHLLAHAKVYALAQYKALEALKALAFRRLDAALLSVYTIKPGHHVLAKYVIELLGYVYSHTDSLASSKEPMRELVLNYAAWSFPVLRTSAGIAELVGGDLALDLIDKIYGRLKNFEAELDVKSEELTTVMARLQNVEAENPRQTIVKWCIYLNGQLVSVERHPVFMGSTQIRSLGNGISVLTEFLPDDSYI